MSNTALCCCAWLQFFVFTGCYDNDAAKQCESQMYGNESFLHLFRKCYNGSVVNEFVAEFNNTVKGTRDSLPDDGKVSAAQEFFK